MSKYLCTKSSSITIIHYIYISVSCCRLLFTYFLAYQYPEEFYYYFDNVWHATIPLDLVSNKPQVASSGRVVLWYWFTTTWFLKLNIPYKSIYNYWEDWYSTRNAWRSSRIVDAGRIVWYATTRPWRRGHYV